MAVAAVCCVCSQQLNGYGNNAAPLRQGQCCDSCNIRIVVPFRMEQIQGRGQMQSALPPAEAGRRLEMPPPSTLPSSTLRARTRTPNRIQATRLPPPEDFTNAIGKCLCDFGGCCRACNVPGSQLCWGCGNNGCCRTGNCGHTCCRAVVHRRAQGAVCPLSGCVPSWVSDEAPARDIDRGLPQPCAPWAAFRPTWRFRRGGDRE